MEVVVDLPDDHVDRSGVGHDEVTEVDDGATELREEDVHGTDDKVLLANESDLVAAVVFRIEQLVLWHYLDGADLLFQVELGIQHLLGSLHSGEVVVDEETQHLVDAEVVSLTSHIRDWGLSLADANTNGRHVIELLSDRCNYSTSIDLN